MSGRGAWRWAALLPALLLAPSASAQAFRSPESRLQWTVQGDVPVLLLATAMTAWPRAFEEDLRTSDPAVRDRASVNPLDRVATRHWSPALSRASDGVLYGGVASAFLLLSSQALARRQDARAWAIRAGVMAESVLVTSGLTQIVKISVRRPRPLWFNPAAPESARSEPDGRLSFWSGHTALVATALTSLTTVEWIDHPGSPEAWTSTALTVVLVPLTATLRVLAGRHYPTDVIAGGLVGVAVGVGVPLLHQWRIPSRDVQVGFLPLADGGALQASGAW
ncbi:MAG TPA: phosphatase PAP2 family protein [Myxococcota bacterium]|nr:phosphatase PAP2 family protein [Myxococcota bacterium]HQK51008.1 phosphatase PAP2 family protein [Myxococcota bacterium]